jgi:hypothetical protein
MEAISGISLQNIFTANNNWSEFVSKFGCRIRDTVIKNVAKVMACKKDLGFAEYTCPCCGDKLQVHFTCKSRFCSPCGKVQTDNWIAKYESNFLDVPYQHVVFTIPQALWTFIQCNRRVGLNILLRAASETLLGYTRNTLGYTPAIMSVIHTFGRDLKFNSHVHCLVSCGGLSHNQRMWFSNTYLHHKPLKILWRNKVCSALRAAISDGTITKTTANIRHIIELCYSVYKDWYVHVGTKLNGAKAVTKYIGRYTKRPAIANTRISSFENNIVTFWFEDHKTEEKTSLSMPAQDFIGKLIAHIHDHHFKQIRYSGLLAPRVKSKLMTIARKLLDLRNVQPWLKVSWRLRITVFSGHDPLHCVKCGVDLLKSMLCFVQQGRMIRVT